MSQIETKHFFTNFIKVFTFGIVLLINASLLSFGQTPIQSDTVIEKEINVGECFDLQFLDSPGSGYGWTLTSQYDTTTLSIRLISSRLLVGDGPKGGQYIRTYTFKGLNNGTVNLKYAYGRPWLEEQLYHCCITVRIN